MEKKNPLISMMQEAMDKVRVMADTNTIVGEPITTPDGVTLIPISKVSMGFGGGGTTFGNKNASADEHLGGGLGSGVKIEPVSFLIIKDGYVRVMPVALPAASTVDRIVEMVPDVVNKIGDFIGKKKTDSESVDNEVI